MSSVDVVVIGAGMAGLVALRELAKAGLRVVAFEARAQTGGRVASITPAGFPRALELGPEFVHGARPALLRLIEESGAGLEPADSAHYTKGARGFEPPGESPWPELGELFAAELTRSSDRSVEELLAASPLTRDQKERLAAFVEGFHAAALTRVSARSVARQMSTLDEPQYRLTRGYDHVRRFVEDAALAHGARLVVEAPVSRVEWQPGSARVSAGFEQLRARAVIVALPLAILNAEDGAEALRFEPELPQTRKKLQSFAMGHAFRVTFQLNAPIWDVRTLGERAFLRAPSLPIHTFWAAGGARAPSVTAWCGGPRALALQAHGRDALLETVEGALAALVDRTPAELQRSIAGVHFEDFTHEPFIRGAYPYALVGNDLESFEPESNTLFFAGDFTDPSELGTVGASVESALHAADGVLRALGGETRNH